jgi:hypothetical protein
LTNYNDLAGGGGGSKIHQHIKKKGIGNPAGKQEPTNKSLFIAITGRRTTRRQATVLRTDQEITDALEDLDSDVEEDLLSRAGSITELSRWIGEEMQLGKEIFKFR